MTEAVRDAMGREAGEREARAARVVLRAPRPGDWGHIVEQHGRLYAAEYGFDRRFEAMVASLVAAIASDLDVRRERCWIAELDGQRVGSACVVREPGGLARLRLLLVEPAARGLGLGGRLVAACVDFARAEGYGGMVLSTQSHLDAARHLYRAAGFRVVASKPCEDYGPPVVSEDWRLDFPR